MTTEKKKFHKMWEVANAWVYDIYSGSMLPIIQSLPKVASFADKNCFFYFEKGRGAFYYEESEIEKAGKAGLSDFSSDAFSERYFSGIADTIEKLELFCRTVRTLDIQSVSDKVLEGLFRESFEDIVEIFGYYLVSNPQCVAGIEADLEKKLSAAVPADSRRDVFALLTMPSELSTIRKEEIAWQVIISSAKKSNVGAESTEIASALKKHLEEYFLLPFGDGGKPWTEDFLKKRLEKDVAQTEPISETIFSPDDLVAQKNEVIKKYNLPDALVHEAALLASIAHARLEMRVRGFMPAYYYNEVVILNEVARRFGYPEEKIRFATPDEIFQIFQGTKFSRSLLEEREEGFLLSVEDGVLHLYSSERARKKFGELVASENYTDVLTVKGNVAMRGTVQGTAAVFMWGDDVEEKLKQFGTATVLVAGQTRPQLMPLISKSVAIVTDEGGITSHAAIVSRELRIPCVIGTKTGTRVIKDGDLIEVDGERGIVTVLKRA